MDQMEKGLSDKKIEIDDLQVPEELESRLNKVLQGKTVSKKRKSGLGMKVAVLLIAFVLVTYNMDTLAYYGKELLGFEGVMNGTLRDLNKMGMGQTIEKSYTFSNGVKVTLNGVMADDNQLLAFYTVQHAKGSVEASAFRTRYMKGAFGRHYSGSGQGQISEDGSLIRWVEEVEPPHAFERKLTWVFDIVIDGKSEEGEISFVLDRDKAMGHTLKTRLNKAIEVDGSNIRFDTITASPTTTIVRGTIKNIVELAADQIGGERIYSPRLGVRLLADGKEAALQGMGASTDLKGMKFDVRYDALPREMKKLQLHLISFGAEFETNQIIKLDKAGGSQTAVVEGQDVMIERVYEYSGETFITITTKEDVVLSRVYLMADSSKVELEETIDSKYDKKTEGTLTHTRTLRFKGTGEDLQLEVTRIRYEKAYDEYIDIPIE